MLTLIILSHQSVGSKNLTSALNSTPKPPGTTSYIQKCVAKQTPSAVTPATNHGQPEPDNLTVAICQVIQLKIAQFAKDITNLFSQMTQQHTALPTTTTMTAMMMPMMLLPTMAPHHGHRD